MKNKEHKKCPKSFFGHLSLKIFYVLYTEEFDSFLLSVGDLYMSIADFERAEIAYDGYIKKFPTNVSGWEKLAVCLQHQERTQEANMARKKAERLSPV